MITPEIFNPASPTKGTSLEALNFCSTFLEEKESMFSCVFDRGHIDCAL